MMNKPLMISLLICLAWSKDAHAQWTKQDSLWLQNVLAGKDSLRLNPETMRAIQGGTLFDNDAPATLMRSTPAQLEILKDFSEYLNVEDAKKVALNELPPGVFWRHQFPEPPRGLSVNPIFNQFVNMKAYAPQVISGSFSHVLSMAFSSNYRQLISNQKKARNLVHYDALPTYEISLQHKSIRNPFDDLPLPSVTRRDTTKLKQATNLPSAVPDSTSVVAPADSLAYKTQPQ